MLEEKLREGTKVLVVNAGVNHLSEFVGEYGKIVSSLVMTVGAPRKYKILFKIDGVEQTAYFLKNEIIEVEEVKN